MRCMWEDNSHGEGREGRSMTYDSNDVKITVKTLSRNGLQDEAQVHEFTQEVLKLADRMLSFSTVDVDVEMHRKISMSTDGPKRV